MLKSEKFNHLKIKKLASPYKYVLFQDSASFWEGVELLKIQSSSEPYFLFHHESDHSMMVTADLNLLGSKEETGWRALQIVGDMPFGTVQGLIAEISESLRKEGLGLCVISTFLTDFFFIKNAVFDEAIRILKKDSWDFLE